MILECAGNRYTRRIAVLAVLGVLVVSFRKSPAEEPFALPRCELLPLPDSQVSFQVDGRERTRWHFGAQYPRPFFYPLLGPSGTSLTRMGHPGAENHDHHRSVWFAHQNVDGVDFWSDRTAARVRQKHWYAYHDGESEAIMASRLAWDDEAGMERMEMDLVAALLRGDDEQYVLEIQITLRPAGNSEMVELGRTNFGLLAVRVAKSLSVHFGSGQLSDSEGRTGEKAIFGRQARWMDYSGPVAEGVGASRKAVQEGITYFDHPDNPRFPTHWHVRADGWMGASFCMQEGWTLRESSPLTLRYLLAVHRGPYEATQAQAMHERFAASMGFEIRKSSRPHRQYEVGRHAANE